MITEWVYDTTQELVNSSQVHHRRAYHHLKEGVLRLLEQGRYIAVERLMVELVEEIYSEVSCLEESKVLPYLDSLKVSLEAAEMQRLTDIVGFRVPSGTKWIQWPKK